MGLDFGRLIRIKGITYYTLSPYEQKALSGIINPGIKNVLRRTKESFFFVTIPILTIYVVVTSLNERYRQLQRKNPEDFVNDV